MSKSAAKLKKMERAELKKNLNNLKGELMKLNSQRATKTVPKKTSQIRDTRKGIARILTILRTLEERKKE